MPILALSAGRDTALLQTRNAILASLGCSVVAASSAPALVNEFFVCDFDVLVLCHSVPALEREKVLRMVEHYRPSAAAIVVTPAFDSMPRISNHHQVRWVAPEPEELAAALQECFPQISLR